MKIKQKLYVMVALVLSCNIANAATTDPNNEGRIFIESNNNNSIFYHRHGYENKFTFPLFVRDLTESYLNALIDAGTRINTALGHTFELESNIWDTPYQNRVFFVEMDIGKEWNGVAMPYYVDGAGAITSCYKMNWESINTDNDFVGLNFVNFELKSICQENGINAGLIIMSSTSFQKHNGNPIPPYNDQVHLVMHEYGHFAGIGHAVLDKNNMKESNDGSGINDDCNSVMVNGQFVYPYTYPLQQKCPGGPPITFSVDDIEVMEFQGFSN